LSPSLGLLTINALVAADFVLIPVQCEFYALEGLAQLMQTVEMVRSSLNNKLRLLGLLMTMYDGRTNLSIQVTEEVKKYFNGQVFKTIIPRNVRLGEAPSHGEPIILYDPAFPWERKFIRSWRKR
jgi:chromosome partitioning protein